MRGFEIWRGELISVIRTLADESELRRLWSGLDPTEISSFQEEIAHVFGDYEINRFIALGPDKVGLSSKQMDALWKFRDEFSVYIERLAPDPIETVSYERVLGDPKWSRVIMAAREFIQMLDAGPSPIPGTA